MSQVTERQFEEALAAQEKREAEMFDALQREAQVLAALRESARGKPSNSKEMRDWRQARDELQADTKFLEKYIADSHDFAQQMVDEGRVKGRPPGSMGQMDARTIRQKKARIAALRRASMRLKPRPKRRRMV